MTKVAHLVLADGAVFSGRAIGHDGETVGEAVFTTGMTGYQEVLTDPSYQRQLVCMTAPQIGNTGATAEDDESARPHAAGFIVHELSKVTSNWRATEPLDAYLKRHRVVGIEGIDTRALTRHLRDQGAQLAAIGTGDPDTLCDKARAATPMTGLDLAREVTTDARYEWTEGSGVWATPSTKRSKPRVVAVDFGVKRNILRCLVDVGCEVIVVPANTSATDILSESPDGVFLSNGPGDPAAVTYAIESTRDLIGKRPIFGICLGHQILSLALGGESYKLKFGHRGLNQPVQDLKTRKVEVTTQNHGFVVDVDSLKGKCELTHLHLNDGTCEGIAHLESDTFSVQYHPEAAAGPHDARYLFERFVSRMTK